jgi:hypothetical protein
MASDSGTLTSRQDAVYDEGDVVSLSDLVHEVVESLGGNVIVRNVCNPHTRMHTYTYVGQADGVNAHGVGVSLYNQLDVEGRVCYKGEYIHGMRHGFGAIIWRHGVRQGVGVYVFPSGNRYFGMWKDDERDGKAIEEAVSNGKAFLTEYRNGAKILRQELTDDFANRFFVKKDAEKVCLCVCACMCCVCKSVCLCACLCMCVWVGMCVYVCV